MAPQAIWVRKNAPRFSAAAGPSSGCIGQGPDRQLVAVGDSIIAGVGAPSLDQALVGHTARALATELDARLAWQAYGRTGERSAGLVARRLSTLPDVDADYVIVSMGVNDVTGLTTTTEFSGNMHAVLRGIRLRYPRAGIAVAGLPPLGVFPLLPQPLRAFLGMRARTLSLVLREVVALHAGVTFVPITIEVSPDRFADDGFHPSPAGYREFGVAMAAALIAASRDDVQKGPDRSAAPEHLVEI
jgi:lysophospholipase L1-like esterase